MHSEFTKSIMSEKEIQGHCSLNEHLGLIIYEQKENSNKTKLLILFGLIFNVSNFVKFKMV